MIHSRYNIFLTSILIFTENHLIYDRKRSARYFGNTFDNSARLLHLRYFLVKSADVSLENFQNDFHSVACSPNVSKSDRKTSFFAAVEDVELS